MTNNTKIFYSVVYLQIKDDDYLLYYFIEHYIKIGFQHIYIIDDNSEIPVFDKIKNHKYFSKLTTIRIDFSNEDYYNKSSTFLYSNYYHVDIPYLKYRQLYILNWFIKYYRTNFKWIFVCDADEYLYLREYKNINNYLKYYSNKYVNLGGVLFYWCIFGSSYLNYFPNDNEKHLFENFTLSENVLSSYGKMIIDVDCISFFSGIHSNQLSDKKMYTPSDKNQNQMTVVQVNNINAFYYHSPSTNIPFSKVNAYLTHYMTTDCHNFIYRRFFRNTANNRDKSFLTITWLSRFNDVLNLDMFKYIDNVKTSNSFNHNLEFKKVISLERYNSFYNINLSNIVDMYKHFYENKTMLFYDNLDIEYCNTILKKYKKPNSKHMLEHKYYLPLYIFLTSNIDKALLDKNIKIQN